MHAELLGYLFGADIDPDDLAAAEHFCRWAIVRLIRGRWNSRRLFRQIQQSEKIDKEWHQTGLCNPSSIERKSLKALIRKTTVLLRQINDATNTTLVTARNYYEQLIADIAGPLGMGKNSKENPREHMRQPFRRTLRLRVIARRPSPKHHPVLGEHQAPRHKSADLGADH
jgi:hypothetical protein